MPVFFRELQRDGQIDRAMAVARGAVRQRTDSWMPVLFMRLRSGRIWYMPGLDRERPGFDKWDALLNNIAQGRCTPIFGSGLVEPLLGTSREIAWRWSEAHHYPMALHHREDLPQVAQYLAVNQDPSFPRDELRRYLRRELLRRYADELPEPARTASLDDLLALVAARRWQSDPAEPHRVLASLPCPIYVTTCPDSLMVHALAAAGKDPQVGVFSWQGDEEPPESIFVREPQYRPDVRRPLVYQLFGQLKQSDSIVLTEDDYFDYLIGATSNKEGIPSLVRRALADTALLFVGFRMEDWNFRVLFRSIMSQQGGGRRRRYAHVAVQIDPEAGRIQEPELARRYLERYFQGADISIYWGSADDFMKELHRRWSQKCQTDLL
jgi:hypothetical protein